MPRSASRSGRGVNLSRPLPVPRQPQPEVALQPVAPLGLGHEQRHFGALDGLVEGAGNAGNTVTGGATGGSGIGLVEGAPADLVVFDRSDSWSVTPATLLSRGKNTPLLGMAVPGRVLLTMADGRVAYEAPEA